MSEFIKSQQELRANLTEQIRDVIEGAEGESRGLDTAELEKIDRIEADIRRADEAIAIAQRNEQRNVEASVAAKGFVMAEAEERSSSAILRDIAATRGSHTFERRTLVPTANTVPKSFFDEVFDVARLVGPMLDVGQRINTASGEDLTLPTLTAYSTASLVAAAGTVADSEPTYSSITLGAYKYGLLIPVAAELVTDAGFDISSHLAEQAGNGLGFAVNAALTTGDGSDKPRGVVTAAGSGITGGTSVSGGFTADNLIDLQYSLDGAARRLPGVAYMAAGSSIGAMRKLKDDAGNYL
jgi:HK97 family phage major capsid protein